MVIFNQNKELDILNKETGMILFSNYIHKMLFPNWLGFKCPKIPSIFYG
jgi:hypothetical protein